MVSLPASVADEPRYLTPRVPSLPGCACHSVWQELGDSESNTVIRRRGVLRELIKLAKNKTKYPDWPFKREVGVKE